MTVTVDVHQAKTHLSRLMDRAHAGEQIILAKAGKPYALLGPIPPSPTTRRAGRLAREYVGPEILLPLPEAVPDAWEEVEMEGLTLVTRDTALTQFPAVVLW